MTKEQIEKFNEIYPELEQIMPDLFKRATKIAKLMAPLNSDYCEFDDYSWHINSDGVYGSVYIADWGDVYLTIPFSMFSLTDEEKQKDVNKKIEAHKKEEQLQKKKEIRLAEERERKEYERLKAKFGS